jgi:four helix bundle protein
MRNVKNYEVFGLADGLALDTYRITRKFPKEELYGLTSQMRRAACSIPTNLAEGAARQTGKEFANFVNIAIGSCEEVRYQVHLASELGYMTKAEGQELDTRFERVKRMLSGLYATLTGRRAGGNELP